MKPRRTYYDAEPWYQREQSQDWYQQMPEVNDAVYELLIDRITPDAVIVEVACGGGWLAEALRAVPLTRYTGFDFAETPIRHARQRVAPSPAFTCVRGDALQPDCYDPEANLIIAHQFFHCLIGADRMRWLRICHAVVKPNGGQLVLSSMIGLPEALMPHVDPETRVNRPHNRYYAMDEEIRAELVRAGFSVTRAERPHPNVGVYVAVA